ncbi:positive regulation of Schwann cell migration [Homalodisca vitripennis]|nr:positive regulation of Schwann cell migration [Homalodisca vitripennis]
MELSWLKPVNSNPDEVLEYYIYYIHHNYTNCKKHSATASYINYLLTNLEPYAQYKVWVKASSNNHDGESSEPVTKQTDVSGPGPPHILNATCVSPSTLAIYWTHPPSFNRTIDTYIIAYREEHSYAFSNITVKPCNYSCQDLCSALCRDDKDPQLPSPSSTPHRPCCHPRRLNSILGSVVRFGLGYCTPLGPGGRCIPRMLCVGAKRVQDDILCSTPKNELNVAFSLHVLHRATSLISPVLEANHQLVTDRKLQKVNRQTVGNLEKEVVQPSQTVTPVSLGSSDLQPTDKTRTVIAAYS